MHKDCNKNAQTPYTQHYTLQKTLKPTHNYHTQCNTNCKHFNSHTPCITYLWRSDVSLAHIPHECAEIPTSVYQHYSNRYFLHGHVVDEQGIIIMNILLLINYN